MSQNSQPQAPTSDDLNGKGQDSISAPPAPASINPASSASEVTPETRSATLNYLKRYPSFIIISAILITIVGLAVDSIWLALTGLLVTLVVSLILILPSWSNVWQQVIPDPWRQLVVATLGLLASATGLLVLSTSNQQGTRAIRINWDAVGALGEIVGALGQIAIAILAVYVAWQQYVISRDLTIQQNRITQQQTIDAYFQGISDLTINDEGLLEDWPQERAIADGRTAAILSSVDAGGESQNPAFFISIATAHPPYNAIAVWAGPCSTGREAIPKIAATEPALSISV